MTDGFFKVMQLIEAILQCVSCASDGKYCNLFTELSSAWMSAGQPIRALCGNILPANSVCVLHTTTCHAAPQALPHQAHYGE